MISQIEKCKEFLIKNGWKYTKPKNYEEYHSFNKEGYISIDFGDNDMVFIDDSGDFLTMDANYYTLIGILMEKSQLSFSLKMSITKNNHIKCDICYIEEE